MQKKKKKKRVVEQEREREEEGECFCFGTSVFDGGDLVRGGERDRDGPDV